LKDSKPFETVVLNKRNLNEGILQNEEVKPNEEIGNNKN